MLYKSLLVWSILCCFVTTLQAQEAIVSTGGEATGNGGRVSYSAGQTGYRSVQGNNGFVDEGVQQVYEISIITGFSNKNIQLTASVYPNPSFEMISLTANKGENAMMEYQLMDVKGRIISSEKILAETTHIPMTSFADGTYIIRVLVNNEEQKSFKIIKASR
ncbi:MAG: T9SS C-terminal target domain-containing protein [Bacteroidetes bacterium]|nr:MAG: T9SS C-terminal target domain-containing protein [Bacteroidota bacterium]REK05210.1 MAG: T9SS C-terminal target domain-containing protein [Bacteroidota bacterium]REK32615.1 MAG: T9SS C-terminal target domain-containing protein [Bacteroidota bacterium]REK48938.1 MAG: T9SS C-terminal target domain-containing protein [Bacteroidota bacterium]